MCEKMNNIDDCLELSEDIRWKLPFREKTELILLNSNGNVLAEDHWNYLMFPGWWVDNDYLTIMDGAIRELWEETSMEIDWELTFLGDVSWKWFLEWANNNKRKERYNKYQWEKVYHFLWKSKHKNWKHLNIEDDHWNNIEWIAINECVKKLIFLANKDHPNTYPYRIVQLNSLRALAIINNIKVDDNTDSIINRLFTK